MAQVPVSMQVMIYPKNKTVPPYPATIVGYAWITGLEVGGGPIIPPDETPPVQPPLVIWGGPIDPYPDIGFPVPQPPIDPPPVDPPAAPTPPHEGWNWSASQSGWYYLHVPGPGEAQPKKK
jgi:hypothetical protein